jgi:hypothetical protein
MLTPIVAFFREEFRWQREAIVWTVGVVTFCLGMLHIVWLEHGFLDEWDYWGGTFGLVLFAVIETILFMWVFRPEQAWRSMHEGADIRIPRVFRFVMTYVTPAYLLVILGWWAVTDALPILTLDKAAGGGSISPTALPYVLASRAMMLAIVVGFLFLIRLAWRRNRYDDRAGFTEEPATLLGDPG